jgi:hypothetical protein
MYIALGALAVFRTFASEERERVARPRMHQMVQALAL